jgi:hypothetical protein
MVNKFIGSGNIERLLNWIITNRDSFAKIQYENWTRIQKTVTELTNIIENELKDWHGEKNYLVKGGKILYHLRNETATFVQKCEERMKFDKGWKGTMRDCVDVFDDYRKKIIPDFVKIASHLESDHPLRIEIETQMKDQNYPMLS